MTFNTLEILSFFVSFMFLFFAGYLLTVKTKKKVSNVLFALYLIVVALDVTAFFYYKFFTPPYWLEMLRVQVLGDLKSPLIFLYFVSVIYDNFKLKRVHLLLLLPLLVNLIILIPNFFLVDNEQQKLFFQTYADNKEIKIISLLGRIVTIAFLFAQAYHLLRYRKIIKQNYSNPNAFTNYAWLKVFLIYDVVGTTVTMIKGYYRDYSDDYELTNNLRIIMLLVGVLFVCWLFSKALTAPKIFQGIDASIIPVKDENTPIEDERIQQIKNYMQTKEPFLDASLTLQKLARQLQIPSRELSVLINQQIGKHFFDFVNEYRIEKAKKLLKNTSKNKLTVLEILYEVGFNSKSSFNTSFKKQVGLTPTQFRKSNN